MRVALLRRNPSLSTSQRRIDRFHIVSKTVILTRYVHYAMSKTYRFGRSHPTAPTCSIATDRLPFPVPSSIPRLAPSPLERLLWEARSSWPLPRRLSLLSDKLLAFLPERYIMNSYWKSKNMYKKCKIACWAQAQNPYSDEDKACFDP